MSVPKEPATAPGPSSPGRDAGIVFATHVLNLVASVAIQALLAWTLAPSGRGSFALYLTLASLLGVAFSPGTDAAAQYYVMSGRMELSRGVSAAVVHATISSLVGIAASFVLFHSPLWHVLTDDDSGFTPLLVLLPLLLFTTALELQLVGLRQFRAFGAASILRSGLQLGSLLVLVTALGGGVRDALWATAASALGYCTYAAFVLRRHGAHLTLRLDGALRSTVHYGIRFYVARLGHSLELALGVVLLGALGTEADVGLFAAASALMLRLLIGAESIVTMLAPRVAPDPVAARPFVAACGRVALAITVVGGVSVSALGTPLVHMLLSPRFAPAVPLLWILVPAICAHALSSILMTYFRGVGRPGICSHSVWISLVTNVGVMVIGYPYLGVAAAPWGMAVGFSLRALILSLAFVRQEGSPKNLFMPSMSDFASIVRMSNAARARAK